MANPYAIFQKEAYWAGDIGYRKDATGQGYRDFLESNLPRTEYIVSKRPGRVLDVGCGMGFLVAHLRRWGIDAWGIDVSQYAIDRAPEEVRPYLTVGSAAKLPFPAGHVDMCVQFGVFEHLTPEDAKAACQEIARVSHRGIMAPGLSTELSMQLPKEKQDQTHRTILDYYGWKSLFPLGYEFELWEGADETWRLANQFKVLVTAPVVYPVGSLGYGGIERLAFLLSRELAKRGIDTTLACAQGSHIPWGVKMLDCGPSTPGDYEGALSWTIMRPRAEEFNVILDLSHSHLAGRLLPYHTRQVSVIWHSPSLMSPPQPRWNVAALSAWQAQEHFYRTGQRAKVLDVHILDDESPPDIRPGDRFLMVGKVSPTKGHLEAACLCQKLRVPLDIVGPWGEVHGYNEQVKALCQDDIQYWGEVPYRIVLELSAQARARIYPVRHDEAHSHALVDSLSVGCPAVVLDRGAMSEVVEHGTTGFVVRSMGEFKEAMLRVDSLDREKIKGRAWARWGAEAVIGRLLPVLTEASRGARW